MLFRHLAYDIGSFKLRYSFPGSMSFIIKFVLQLQTDPLASRVFLRCLVTGNLRQKKPKRKKGKKRLHNVASENFAFYALLFSFSYFFIFFIYLFHVH